MNTKLFETLTERGYIYQTTDEDAVKNLLNGKPITAYVGIDPTADSLHIGHCLPLIVAKHLQDAGHNIIVVLGGATAMIGDPSGKTEMRQMVTTDFINKNRPGIEKAISKFIKLDGENPAIIVNNMDWFKGYDYIDFMRDIGVHFNVNQMLSCDAYKNRLESGGLTFFEMGYMLMQAYDFVYLNKKYNCVLEFGGSDQWANIVAGANLVRKLSIANNEDPTKFQAFTNTLLLNSNGKKMGKTEKGALWVDKEKCSPYEFYQYFYNVDDKDTERLFKLLTFVDLKEIEEVMSGDIRDAKKRFAFEITKLVHGEEEALNVIKISESFFKTGDLDNCPSIEVKREEINQGILLTDLLVLSKIASSKSEARRLIEQSAITFNNEKVTDIKKMVTLSDFTDNYVLIKKGKKTFVKVTI